MSHAAEPARSRSGVGRLASAIAGGLVALVALGGSVALLWQDPAPPEDLVISEVVSSNGRTLADEDGDYPDWLELHNPRDHPIDLENYRLTDGPERQWMLPARVLRPGEFLVVFASDKDRAPAEGELHTNFKLSKDGLTLGLLAADGVTVLDELVVPALPRDASFGRHFDDVSKHCFFAFPSPGEANSPECFADDRLGEPAFSVPSGVYDEGFELSITSPLPEATIIYTLDGSYPDLQANAEATRIYTEPLSISNRTSEPNALAAAYTPSPLYTMPSLDAPVPKGTVVRARSLHGNLGSAAYFVGLGRDASSLPVVSVAVTPSCLFDPEDGIYVPGRVYDDYLESDAFDPSELRPPANYSQTGREWECPRGEPEGAAVHYCDVGEACTDAYGAGVRVHGAWSRLYALKSLRLYARDDYGSPSFAGLGPFEPEFGDHSRLILRQSGEDLKLMFRDAYLQSLLTNLQVDTQAYQPVSVFLNGEYWGLMNLRERYDEHYLAAVHGADPDAVALIKRHWEVAVGPVDAAGQYQELLEYVAANDPTAPATVERIHSTIDVDSFFDAVLTNIFMVNIDWPDNNTAIWRQYDHLDDTGGSGLDGRWRWMVFDLDHHGGAVGYNNFTHNILHDKLSPNPDPMVDNGIPFLFHRLMENEDLRDRFLTRFADHLNTAFLPEYTTGRLAETAARVAPELPAHIARWQHVESMDEWWSEVAGLERFMDARPRVQRNQLVDYFNLQGTATVEVATSPREGHVQVNTLDIVASTPGVLDAADWSGEYFLGLPVTVTAVPADGYRFVRWQGTPQGATVAGSTLSFVLGDDVSLSPVFAKTAG